jgi:hypothetical protein
MIDPLTALSVASAAVGQIKQLVSAGHDASQAISKFAGAFADVQEAHRRATNPPWYRSFSGSIEEEAANAFAAKKKIEAMRAEVETMIRFIHGPSGLEEYKNIIRDIKKRREQHEYRKERIKDGIIEWTIGILSVLVGAAILAAVFYYIGKQQGKW